MCRRVTCERCGKATFAGCGAHVEQVLGGVPKEERCACDAGRANASEAPRGDRAKAWWPFGR